eukprot:gene17955-biopygen9912
MRRAAPRCAMLRCDCAPCCAARRRGARRSAARRGAAPRCAAPLRAALENIALALVIWRVGCGPGRSSNACSLGAFRARSGRVPIHSRLHLFGPTRSGGTGNARAMPAPPQAKRSLQPAPRPRHLPVPPGPDGSTEREVREVHKGRGEVHGSEPSGW